MGRLSPSCGPRRPMRSLPASPDIESLRQHTSRLRKMTHPCPQRRRVLRCAESPRSHVLRDYVFAHRFFAPLASAFFLRSLPGEQAGLPGEQAGLQAECFRNLLDHSFFGKACDLLRAEAEYLAVYRVVVVAEGHGAPPDLGRR